MTENGTLECRVAARQLPSNPCDVGSAPNFPPNRQIVCFTDLIWGVRAWRGADPQMLHVVDGFPSTVVSFGSDAPHLGKLGKRLLIGPGSILDAHTADERISKKELMKGVDIYEQLARKLLS